MSVYRLRLLLNNKAYEGQIYNWEDFIPIIARNERYHTIIPSFTVDKLTLINDAARFVKNQFESSTVLAKISAKIQRWDDATKAYIDMITGTLDMLSYDIDNNSGRVSIGIKQEDVVNKWLKRDEKDVDVLELEDLDGNNIASFTNETVTVNMHNQIYDAYVEAEVTPGTVLGPVVVQVGQAIGNYQDADGNYVIQLGTDTIKVNEIPEEYFNLPIAYAYDFDANNGNLGQVTPFLSLERYDEFDYDADIRFEWEIDYDVTVSRSTPPVGDEHFTLYYQIIDGTGLTASIITLEASAMSFSNEGADPQDGGRTLYRSTGTLLGDEAINRVVVAKLQETDVNDKIKLFCYFDPGSNFDSDFENESCEITYTKLTIEVDRQVKYPETTCRGMLVHEAFLRVLQKITGVADPLRSDFYGRTDSEVVTYDSDGAGSARLVTNGYQVRQFPLSEGRIYLNFYDLYRAFHALDNIGVGYENGYIRIEPLSYFYGNTEAILVITDPKDFKETVNKNVLYSEIKAGNTQFEDEKDTILRSPHTPREYSIRAMDEVVKQTYDIENPAITSGHLIEKIRQDTYIGATTKDNRYDDQLIIVAVRKSAGEWFSEKSESFAEVTGFDYPDEQYNLKLTPARSLLAHANILRITNLQDQGIIFTKGLGNIFVSTRLSTEIEAVEENQNFANEDFASPLFSDKTLTFQYPITMSKWQEISNEIKGAIIEVHWRGGIYKGFTDQLKVTSTKTMLAEFKLYKTAD